MKQEGRLKHYSDELLKQNQMICNVFL